MVRNTQYITYLPQYTIWSPMPTFIHYTLQNKGQIFNEYSEQEQGQQYIQGQHNYACIVIMTTDKIFDIYKLQIREGQIQV